MPPDCVTRDMVARLEGRAAGLSIVTAARSGATPRSAALSAKDHAQVAEELADPLSFALI
jgi:hypothetical protein